MNITVRTIEKRDHHRVRAFQCEYLDQESFDEFVMRIEANPDLYILVFDEDELVGVCYGDPSNKDESTLNLQGIAVNLDKNKGYARKGIGTLLIREFEKIAKGKGYSNISVGCADDLKVESFYLKSGFSPCELVAKGQHGEEYQRVKISNYEFGKKTKEELRNKYKPKEVIFIFDKVVD
jgi:predicted N-acetyltransferase YhbS